MDANHGGKTWPVGLISFGVGVVTPACYENSFFFPPSLDLLVVVTGSSPAWSRRLGWRPLSLAMQTCPRVPSWPPQLQCCFFSGILCLFNFFPPFWLLQQKEGLKINL